jgi:hypothetical protein
MNIDQTCRFLNYGYYRMTQAGSMALKAIDEKLSDKSLKPIRVALAAIVYLGAALIGCAFTWKWIVASYVIHSVLDMTLEPRQDQRWDDLLYRGLNLGLAARVAYVVLNSLFHFSVGGVAQGLLLGGAIFFKNDWDQHDWSRFVIWSNRRENLSADARALSA